MSRVNFNPHSRKGSDLSIAVGCGFYGISIHTPARGVTMKHIVVQDIKSISIHTPARGVTKTR